MPSSPALDRGLRWLAAAALAVSAYLRCTGPPVAGRSRNDRRAPNDTVATSGSRIVLRTVSACQATASEPSR